MPHLNDLVAVVTGATRGVGRGVARALAAEGAHVYITGRSAADGAGELAGPGGLTDDGLIAIRCDHSVEEDVANAFARIEREATGVDILVNNVWGGYERMIDNGIFTSHDSLPVVSCAKRSRSRFSARCTRTLSVPTSMSSRSASCSYGIR